MKTFLEYSEGKYLYHATFIAFDKSIRSRGLRKNTEHKNWEDSKKVVYLATSADIALSYAETAEDVSDEIYDSGIIIYQVEVKNLDDKKIKGDRAVRGSSGDTIEYHADIPSRHLKVHSKHKT